MIAKNYKIIFIFFSIFLINTFVYSEIIKLTDGSILNGTITSTDADKIVVKTDIGKITIPKYKIASINYHEDSSNKEKDKTNITIQQNVNQNNQQSTNSIQKADENKAKIDKLRLEIQLLIINKAFLNPGGKLQINNLSSDLPNSDKLLLYENNKRKDQWLGFGLNLLITSLGSWVQGDWGGALTVDGLVFGGCVMVLGGASSYSGGLEIAGAISMLTGYIYSIVRPFNFVNNWNKKIQESLGLNNMYISFLDNKGQSIIFYNKNNENEITFLKSNINLLSFHY